MSMRIIHEGSDDTPKFNPHRLPLNDEKALQNFKANAVLTTVGGDCKSIIWHEKNLNDDIRIKLFNL